MIAPVALMSFAFAALRRTAPFVLVGLASIAIASTWSASARADVEGASDHPALSRYPDSVIEWYEVENYRPFRVPVGPVTGYRAIGEWEDVEGRVTRVFYSLKGSERTHTEVWKNFKDALAAAGFDIIAEGVFPERNVKGDVGGRNWLGVYYIENAWTGGAGTVAKMVSGTSTSGGTGAVFGKKVRAEDTIYVLVTLEQHSAEEVAILVDVVETAEAETGLVTADADAMGADIEEFGRTVLDGLFFEFDKAVLTPESKPALDEIAKLLNGTDKSFYVVGHTDAKGTFAYNMKLSADRAEAVRAALVQDYDIDPARLQSAGVGPLSPVFANTTDGGREKNRRVELVEK
ncbi:MAG: OmpA family protein [Pseudomonadota bacterium]